ncbi:hypothetical protein [Desulfurobacterium atlanticum]|uniref:Uncharacterized protein n=1 Tax=Desulfurobacterium atlanticum TaxID=240169 RepID=A0A238Y604_9BACT|nr:hypothetical protein [Desulfurobacterium atlanticum]SNR65769.1 hypothetical protein SAMN06265340_10292 [Desulfurobacterium atlanticum]
MVFLKDLLEDYVENSGIKLIVKDGIDVKDSNIEEGTVFEIETEKNPILVAVINAGELNEVVLMSYQYEFATENDLIIHFEHPLRDVWMLEGDFVFYLSEGFLKRCTPVGKIPEEALKKMKKFLEDDDYYFDKTESGVGRNLPIKVAFKKFEAERTKALLGELLTKIDQEEESSIPKVLTFFVEENVELPAAAKLEKTAVEMADYLLFKEDSHTVKVKVINPKLINREAKIKLGSTELEISALPEEFRIVLQNPVNLEAFSKILEIEVDDELG